VDAEKMAWYTIRQTELFRDRYLSGEGDGGDNPAAQGGTDPTTNPVAAAFPVVSPDMDKSKVEEIAGHPLVAGFKPYRLMSSTGDVDECSITDFLPEKQIEAANTYGLIILLHMSKRRGPEDPENIKDLKRLTEEYPRVKWQLAHCARSFNPLFLERSISQLKEIPNLWYDTSAVCESEVFDILFREVPTDRILYGSDHMPGHVDGGKYVAFARGWMYLNPKTADLNLTHCDPGTFPMVYEELRAMKNAMKNAGYGDKEKEAVFFSNTKNLIAGVLGDK
jgi:glutamate-1-semialdehyde 2,1-aminomutase